MASALELDLDRAVTRKVCTVVGLAGGDLQGAAHRRAMPRSWACLHTATKAIRIGRAVQAARRAHTDPVDAVVKSEQGLLVFRGKVTDVLRRGGRGLAARHRGDRGTGRRIAARRSASISRTNGRSAG